MAGEKVLVVDDQADVVELLESSFALRGYRVISARNGQEALAKVYQEQPDVVLLDIMMPVFDGYEICRILKSGAETKHIPVIFITAKGRQADIERGFELRADGYVVKPFEPLELTDFTEKILAKSRQSNPVA
jgi:two-component system, OmpR family, alkaline phosphatase synthesis response regulator PhoP